MTYRRDIVENSREDGFIVTSSGHRFPVAHVMHGLSWDDLTRRQHRFGDSVVFEEAEGVAKFGVFASNYKGMCLVKPDEQDEEGDAVLVNGETIYPRFRRGDIVHYLDDDGDTLYCAKVMEEPDLGTKSVIVEGILSSSKDLMLFHYDGTTLSRAVNYEDREMKNGSNVLIDFAGDKFPAKIVNVKDDGVVVQWTSPQIDNKPGKIRCVRLDHVFRHALFYVGAQVEMYDRASQRYVETQIDSIDGFNFKASGIEGTCRIDQIRPRRNAVNDPFFFDGAFVDVQCHHPGVWRRGYINAHFTNTRRFEVVLLSQKQKTKIRFCDESEIRHGFLDTADAPRIGEKVQVFQPHKRMSDEEEMWRDATVVRHDKDGVGCYVKYDDEGYVLGDFVRIKRQRIDEADDSH